MHTTIIVGAGISGLICAQTLKEDGFNVTLIDKARGVGGRMSTRRSGSSSYHGKEAIFDHGAQFFTVRDPRFAKLVEQWQSMAIVGEWCRGFLPESEDGHPRYVGLNGMTSAPKQLASDLNVILNTKVSSIKDINNKWSVLTEDGEEFFSDAVVLTAPVPQSLDILDNGSVRLSDEVRSELESIVYDPCIAVLAEIDGLSLIPNPGAIQINGSNISWICDNSKKGISAEVNTVTIHTSAEFARENWDSDKEDIADVVLNEVADLLGSKVVNTQVHKWRYSLPVNPYQNSFLIGIQSPPLIFCGDAFGDARVEGAFLSGLEAAEHLIKMKL